MAQFKVINDRNYKLFKTVGTMKEVKKWKRELKHGYKHIEIIKQFSKYYIYVPANFDDN